MNYYRTCFFLLTFFLSLNSCDQKKNNNNLVETNNNATKTRNINAGGIEFTASVAPELNEEFCSIGIMPDFPGGYDSLKSFVLSHIEYPESAIRDSIEGIVAIKFTVDTNGKIFNPVILKRVRADLDTLCFAMVSQMPKWSVALLKGKPIAVNFYLPIKFRLTHTSSADTATIATNSSELESKIYPNPTADIVNIELQQKNKVTYLLTNFSGKTILEGQFNDYLNKLDLSEQPSGVYILSLISATGKQKHTTRIVKTK